MIIAAFGARGLCQSVLELCLDRHVVLLSEHLVGEVTENLRRKVRLPREQVAAVGRFLRSIGVLVSPTPLATRICRDPDDDLVLALATKGATDAIVSGDKDLLVLGRFESIPIMAPRAFWESQRAG